MTDERFGPYVALATEEGDTQPLPLSLIPAFSFWDDCRTAETWILHGAKPAGETKALTNARTLLSELGTENGEPVARTRRGDYRAEHYPALRQIALDAYIENANRVTALVGDGAEAHIGLWEGEVLQALIKTATKHRPTTYRIRVYRGSRGNQAILVEGDREVVPINNACRRTLRWLAGVLCNKADEATTGRPGIIDSPSPEALRCMVADSLWATVGAALEKNTETKRGTLKSVDPLKAAKAAPGPTSRETQETAKKAMVKPNATDASGRYRVH